MPDDVAIVGFDDIQAKLFFPIPLTSIGTANGNMSHGAVDILMKRIKNENTKKSVSTIIDTSLVKRKTT